MNLKWYVNIGNKLLLTNFMVLKCLLNVNSSKVKRWCGYAPLREVEVPNGCRAYVICLACCGGLGSCMFCCGGLWMNVYLNFWNNKSPPYCFQGTRCQARRRMILLGVDDIWALLLYFLCTLKNSSKSVLPLHSQCQSLIYLKRESWSNSTLSNGSFTGILRIWILMQDINFLLYG